MTESVKRIRELDENVQMANAGSPTKHSDLPEKRMKDEESAKQQDKINSENSAPVAPVVVKLQPRPHVPRSTVGKIFHVLSNDELKSIVENEDKLVDTSVIFLAHAQWSLNKIQHVVDDIHLHSEVSAVAIYTVDVDDVDDAGELLHIESFPLPVAVLYHFDHEGVPSKVSEKKVSVPVHVHALSLVKPVHSIDHLRQKMSAALQADGPSSYTIVYYGASWCPPCMRILQHLPEMLPQLPNTVSLFLKADKDTVQPLFDLMNVEKIPTFQILKNSSASAEASSSDWKPELVGSLQNSSPIAVSTFIEKHCAVLSFSMDDDF